MTKLPKNSCRSCRCTTHQIFHQRRYRSTNRSSRIWPRLCCLTRTWAADVRLKVEQPQKQDLGLSENGVPPTSPLVNHHVTIFHPSKNIKMDNNGVQWGNTMEYRISRQARVFCIVEHCRDREDHPQKRLCLWGLC